MELLYIWINTDRNSTIRQQGFNFSPEYDFEAEMNDGVCTIRKSADWKPTKSVFRSYIISGLTAVVGKNGTGKTTLLEALLHCDGTPYTDRGEPEYEAYDAMKNAIAETILIYEIQGTPEIFHTLKHTEVLSADGYTVHDLNDHDEYMAAIFSPYGYGQTMRVYLSNSFYAGDSLTGLQTFSNLLEVSLTPDNLNLISTKYYQNMFHINSFDETSPRNEAREWLKVVYKSKTQKDFQAICDILYFHKLEIMGKAMSYSAKINKSIAIEIDFPHQLVDRCFPNMHRFQTQQDVPNGEKWLFQLYRYSEKLGLTLSGNTDRYTALLYLYLLIEWTVDSGNSEYTLPTTAQTKSGLKNYADSHRAEIESDEWLKDAFDEIREFSALSARMKRQQNPLPHSDLAYNAMLLVSEKNKKLYNDFIAFIQRLYDKPHSFLLRCLRFTTVGMSSGERAFQNFFSWLNLINEFKRIVSGPPFELPHNLLLLIDEVDLYMHPEWQQKFIKNLIEEINEQFQGHSVQIVLATHSPLCLSDIPRENCIYLNRINGQCAVVPRKKMNQTFGRDIYSLLDNAFFMDAISMGSFASDYINQIIKRINRIDSAASDEEIAEIREMIAPIGNELISKKLIQMLNNKTRGFLYSRKEYLEKELEKVNRKIEEQL